MPDRARRPAPETTIDADTDEQERPVRATLIHAPRDIRVEDVPDPSVQGPTDALVRVVAACVCGSDLWPYRGVTDTSEPRRIGHEFVGVVEALGSDVSTLSVGDFVIAPFALSDGTCVHCRNGVHTSCANGAWWGGEDSDGRPIDAGQGEAVRVPMADGTLVATPAMPDESQIASLLTLSDVMGTGHHAALAAGVAALLDDVGGAELPGQRLPLGVAAERDDAFGAELLGRQDAEEADRAVSDDRDRLARSGLGGDGGEPAGAEDVGGSHERRDEVRLRYARGRDQGAVREWDAGQFGLGAEGAHQHAVRAVRLVAGQADLAGVVGGPERADDEVANLDGAHRGTNFFDDADVFVAHHLVVDRLGAAVRPQVAAADARRRQADDGIGRLDDPRILAVFDPDVPRTVHDYLTHRSVLLFVASIRVVVTPIRRHDIE